MPTGLAVSLTRGRGALACAVGSLGTLSALEVVGGLAAVGAEEGFRTGGAGGTGTGFGERLGGRFLDRIGGLVGARHREEGHEAGVGGTSVSALEAGERCSRLDLKRSKAKKAKKYKVRGL